MKVVSTALAACVLVLATVGCGHASGNTAQAPHVATHQVSSATPSPPATTSGNSTANERAFADALASTTSLIPDSVISGPAMRAYRLVEYEINAAHAATGNPFSAETVTPIPGGYQLCLPDTGNGAQCGDITQFVTNPAGQITGVSVGGAPVEARIATGSSSQMAGLMVSGVVAYLSLQGGSKVYVTFKIQDVSYKPINSSPACLATFSTRAGTYSADNFNSLLPSTLTPGETVYGYAIFNTTQITGTLTIHSNDGYNVLLASSTLHKIGLSSKLARCTQADGFKSVQVHGCHRSYLPFEVLRWLAKHDHPAYIRHLTVMLVGPEHLIPENGSEVSPAGSAKIGALRASG